MSIYNIIAATEESTVVAEYIPDYAISGQQFQTEAALEAELLRLLREQGYAYFSFTTEKALIENLRAQLEKLNNFTFSDNEWDNFFTQVLANSKEGIEEKSWKIQENYVHNLRLDDGSSRNINLLDKKSIHNNRLQVINQYEETGGKYKSRYDVTILVNGLPLIHLELKRRGVAIREAFNQIKRYQRDSFWASKGLFEYVQLFVISNGTHTKYYSNTTRNAHIKEQQYGKKNKGKKTSNSFEFTSFWADANNKIIPDLVDFTKTFFAKHTILSILTKYCVFTSEKMLLVLRPYQIAATERILNRIIIAANHKYMGSIKAGGYIWHTTGSGKTLTSFKTAILASQLENIDKVLFVVDRKDLDYQTMKEYDRFEKGAANGNNSTSVLQRQLENRNRQGGFEEYKIIVTTIAKVWAIDREKALAAPERISEVVAYTLEHFNQKTKRQSFYSHRVKWEEEVKGSKEKLEKSEERILTGFNSIFAAASIPMAIKYYQEFKKQNKEKNKELKIGTIFSFAPNEEEMGGTLTDETMDAHALDQNSRDFLESAIADYNKLFSTNFDTSAEKFQNYYKDLSLRVKNRELDLLIVVNMFLTGFDATTLNTLWVDKNLRQHGLLQAFSRTNRILNSVKTFGNIVCFRDLKEETDKAIALFGDKDAGGIVLLKTYEEYYNGYEEKGVPKLGYKELIQQLLEDYPLGEQILGESKQKDFIRLYGQILRLRNILTAFDDFENDQLISDRDLQDYQSMYIDLYQEFKKGKTAEKENINDDIIFEIELIKQIEVNIDYILMLLKKYSDSKCQDKEVLTTIGRAVNASMELRSKKDLIENFIKQINTDTEIDVEWKEYLRENKEKDIEKLIAEEKLKENETKKFLQNAFRDGELRTTGTTIDKIMPPVSRFAKTNRGVVKQNIIDKLLALFDKYFGVG